MIICHENTTQTTNQITQYRYYTSPNFINDIVICVKF